MKFMFSCITFSRKILDIGYDVEGNLSRLSLHSTPNVGRRGDSLTVADKNKLSQVAKKCVSEVGEAVHWARALLTEHEYTDYSTYDNCAQEAEVRSIASSKVDASAIKIFPNPTNNIVDIDFGSSEINIIKIYNAVGQLLDEIKSDKTLYRYNMQNLKEGIYIFEIEDNNQQMTTIKVLKH